jgi:hypothetical protein
MEEWNNDEQSNGESPLGLHSRGITNKKRRMENDYNFNFPIKIWV